MTVTNGGTLAHGELNTSFDALRLLLDPVTPFVLAQKTTIRCRRRAITAATAEAAREVPISVDDPTRVLYIYCERNGGAGVTAELIEVTLAADGVTEVETVLHSETTTGIASSRTAPTTPLYLHPGKNYRLRVTVTALTPAADAVIVTELRRRRQ